MNKEEVEQELKGYDMGEFNEFMNGKTVGINKDGTIDIYEVDVDKFKKTHNKKGEER